MSIHMAENIKEERARWVEPIAEGQTTITEVMRIFPHGKRTLERWLAAYEHGGEAALEPHSMRPNLTKGNTDQDQGGSRRAQKEKEALRIEAPLET